MRRALPTSLALVLVAAPSAGAATKFYVKGAGYGHGVGMSQYGSQGYALHGKSYRWILAHYYQGTSLGQASPATRVQVALASGGSLSVSHARRAGRHALNRGGFYTASASGGKVALSSGGRVVARARRLVVSGSRGHFTLGGHGNYRGSLRLTARSGGVSAVNVVSLDQYTKGVVAGEMPSSWEPDALKVQAVAARSYALTTGVGSVLYPDTRSQVYRGMSGETAATNAAVRATRGQVVTYHGTPITTFYFSTSGGHTENVENIFGGDPEPYLVGVRDRYDSISPHHRWTLRMTRASAAAKLSGLYSGSFRGIHVIKRGVSPRIVRARVIGTSGSSVTTGPTLRSRFGAMDSWMRFYVIRAGAIRAGGTPAARGAAGTGAVPERIAHRQILSGAIVGARRGALAIVQRRTGAGDWRVAGTAHVGRRGAVSWTADGPGLYRLSWLGMTSAPVRL
jgi:stage II sporulation protein D